MTEIECKYKSMKSEGHSATEVYKQAKADGLNGAALAKTIRNTFSLSMLEYKEVWANNETGKSLAEHQADIALDLGEIFDQLDKE